VGDSPNWALNLLMGAVCVLSTMVIPIIGQLVFLGYNFEIIEALHLDRRRRAYPDFSFDRFTEYLIRGAWPFLVSLIVSVVATPLIMVVLAIVGLPLLIMLNARGDNPGGLLVLAAGLTISVVTVAGMALMALAMVPMMLRAGLAQDFGEGFNLEFIKDFIRRVWKETILAYLFLVVSALVVSLAGLVLLCVGIFPAAALIMLAQAHLHLQLYELYLARGGTPIPLPARLAPPA